MTHDELRSRAALVAALPDDDPDRAGFLEHARSCAECTAALRQGQRLQQMLGEVRLPAPSPEALRRAREPVLAEMRPAARGWWLRAAAAVPPIVFPVVPAPKVTPHGLMA